MDIGEADSNWELIRDKVRRGRGKASQAPPREGGSGVPLPLPGLALTLTLAC